MFQKLKDLKQVNLMQLLKLHKIKKQLIFVIAVIAVILLNSVIAPLALRLDLSQGKAYTLSDSTRKIIQKNDKKITISFFVTSDLPTRLLPLKADVTDLLKEYEKQGKNIQVTILDPKKDQNALKKTQELGIPPLQFSQLDQDKYAVTESYFGISIEQGMQHESIPQVTDVESLEYNLTSAIYKLIRSDIPKIAILGYPESPDPSQDPISAFRGLLRNQFTVESLTIATEGGKTVIDPSCKAIIVFDDNQKQYSQFELDVIKSYLDKKGKALFFADGVWVDEALNAQPARNNLSGLLKNYGIEIQTNLVLSSSAEVVNFGDDLVNIYTPYYFWIKTGVFNPAFSYFSNITQMTYPWVSSINVSKKNGYEAKDLAKTTEESWIQKDMYTLNPQQVPEPQESDLKQFVVSAQTEKKDGAKIVVVPSSRFLLNRFIPKGAGNLEFGLNVMNDLASGGALTGIRQRAVSIYPLPNLAQNEQDIFKYLNILLLPGLFALYGVYRIMKRK